MKPFRLLLIVAGAAIVLLAVAIGVAFNGSFQTWAVRRVLAGQPGLGGVTVEAVSGGLNHVEVRALRVQRDGMVLTVPRLEADLPVLSAAWRRRLQFSRLVARGWLLELPTQPPAPGTVSATAPAATPPAKSAASSGSAAQTFAGIFRQLELPVDLALDGLELEGNVILPAGRGEAKVLITGGGLRAKQQGQFDFVLTAKLNDTKVTAVDGRGHLVAAMDTPHTITGISAKLDAAAQGAQFPNGVKLTADVSATRAAAGESYAVAVVADGRDLVQVRADFPTNAQRLEGSWKINVRDADLAPFAFGQPLPAFTAAGEGKFDADAAFKALHASGRFEGKASRLEVVAPALSALGELQVAADFDLAESGGTVVVQKLQAAVSGPEPVATIRSLQPFELQPRTGALRANDPSSEVVAVVLQGVPVAWARPFLQNIQVTGGTLRGELVAMPRGGGVSVHSTKTLLLDGISVALENKPLVERVNVSLSASADYTPQGWQAELNGLTLTTGDATIASSNLKVGQLAGAGQPLKATGKVEGNVAALLSQPALKGVLALAGGEAAIEFAASVAAKQEVQAKLTLRNLTGPAPDAKLPAVSADLRADMDADGKIAFNAPLLLERNERKSDLLAAGTLGPLKDGARSVEVHVTSNQLFVDDAQLLSSALPPRGEGAQPAPPATPPWAGYHGTVDLQLKRLVYSDTFEATNVAGRIRLDAGMLKLEGMQAGLGETGRANVNGTVTFSPDAAQPFALNADVSVKQFDPASLFRALDPQQPPTVEGRFDITSKLAGRASEMADLASGAGGQFQLTSRGGTFRGLPVNVASAAESTGKIAGWIASAGTAISSITGKKDHAEIANKAQAVTELVKGLNPITYDQLSVVLTRDAALNTTLRNFTLIAPEVRLTGTGTALHRAGSNLLQDSLAMEFKLRARGRQAEVLRYLGALEAQPDDFGYMACTLPLSVGGTLGKPDTSELNTKLAALALEKAGVTEKAADFVNRIFGGK